MKCDFLFKNGLKGLPNDARFVKNFMNWLARLKKERNSFKFRGIGTKFISKVLSSKVITSVSDVFNSSHSISSLKNIKF